MNPELNALLLEHLKNADIPATSGAHRLCLAIVDVIETEHGTSEATNVVNAFASRRREEGVRLTTGIELLHFFSENIGFCPIGKLGE